MGVLKTDLLWYVIPTMLVLFSLLAFLDSKNGKLYVSRLVALAVVLISIGLLYLEPFYFAAADVDTVIITTDGANKEDSLRLKYPNNKFIEWSDTINASDLKNHVVINGYGFPEYDLYKLEGKKVDFIPADKPSGIIDVNYNSIANVGENRAVQLKVNDLKDSWIKLSMLGDVVDSVQVATDSMELVALNFTPLIAGKSLLKLIVENNTSISQEEQLPVVVQEPDKSAVLMLNDQPTFESRFLKNHLIEQGHKVFVRSKITTERFRYENSGFEFDKLPYLSDHVLSEFDLLVIPATIISNLSRTERLSIEKKIRESGLGLLVLVSSASDKIPSWLDFSVQALEDEKYQLELSNKRIAVESIGNISSKNVLSECHLAANEVCLKVTQPLGQG
ncbi:MAG: hypothetical protein RLO81_10820, partial [Fulvivirga sp.]|uniref:hypothetical protein n=1 Tax=Fulvivirga sp. TaxID=1931237 RepID=UPI0032F01B07